MRSSIKNSVFLVSKYLGLFSLSRWLLRNKVRVLCYHGFTMNDEHKNVPGLFIEPEEFEKRISYLQRKGYKVIGLEQAYREVGGRVKSKDRVVLTIDDGYVSVLREAAPIMKQYNFPSTLYVTSYFLIKIARFLLWRLITCFGKLKLRKQIFRRWVFLHLKHIKTAS